MTKEKIIPNYSNTVNTFIHIIGYIQIILNIQTFKDGHKEYKYVLDKVSKWASEYELTRNLNFIKQSEVDHIYKILDEMQTKFICNDQMGPESELSDYALNWFWHLMVLRKEYYNQNKM